MQRHGASLRKTFAVIKLSRETYFYRSTAKDSTVLVLRMKEINQTRVHYGYRHVHVMLKREGFKDNHKRVYRLYKAQGLSLSYKRPKRNKPPSCASPRHWRARSINCGAWILLLTTYSMAAN